MNALYYGDNLDVLRRYIADESVDLVYLDPPFKSNQNYNVLFAERDGTQAAAQIKVLRGHVAVGRDGRAGLSGGRGNRRRRVTGDASVSDAAR